MKRIISLSFLLCALLSCAYAQESTNSNKIIASNGAEIYVKEELSRKLWLIAEARLFHLECSTGDAFRISAGLEGDFFLPKFASFHASFLQSYFNIQKMHAKTLNKDQNNLTGFSLFEAGGRFHFVDKIGKAKHKLILSSSQSGNIITTEYLRAKLPCRRIWAIRGGFYSNTTTVSTDMNSSELKVGGSGAVKTKDGLTFSDSYFTNCHTVGFYVGLSSIVNMSVRTTNNVTGYQGSRFFTSFFKEVYADVILAPSTFDAFKVGGVSHTIEANKSGSFQTSDIGWRLGKTIAFTRKKPINVAYNFEIGNRPGLAGHGIYFNTGINLTYLK